MGSQYMSQVAIDEKADSRWSALIPFQYENLKISYGSRPVGFRFSKHIVNIEGYFQSIEINSCGEASTLDLAKTKAVAELIERTAMWQWCKESDGSSIKTSNGWAAHQTMNEAKMNAVFERVERDAVLAQWYFKKPFFEIDLATLPDELQSWTKEELSQSEFPQLRVLLSTEGLGPSITCIFMNADGFGVSSHSSGLSIKASIESAIAEACRVAHHTLRRSFWKDSLRLKTSDISTRVAPGAHAVYYAYHEAFPAWMFGPVQSWFEASQYWKNRIEQFQKEIASEFQFNSILTQPLHVGYATHPDCLELLWGPTTHKHTLEIKANKRFAAFLSEGTINTKPHIVS